MAKPLSTKNSVSNGTLSMSLSSIFLNKNEIASTIIKDQMHILRRCDVCLMIKLNLLVDRGAGLEGEMVVRRSMIVRMIGGIILLVKYEKK